MKTILIKSRKYGAFEVIIDDDDYDRVSKYQWHIVKSKGRMTRYARSYLGRGRAGGQKLMHVFIMGNTNGLTVDHVDFNGLNNQKSNLRLATKLNQAENRRRRATSSMKYKGIFYDRKYMYYRARLNKGKKQIYNGSYKTQEEAALAYNELAKKHFGEFAYLNEIKK